MDRRNFIRMVAAGTAMGAVVPRTLLANERPGVGGLFYTEQNPGRWSGKTAGHVPNVEVARSEAGVSLRVVTAHEMNEYEHYIVKHIVLDENYGFLAEKMFDPTVDNAAQSEFSLEDYSGELHVLSVCNKHDTWVKTITV